MIRWVRHGHVMPYRPAHTPEHPDAPKADAEQRANTSINTLITLLARQAALEARSWAALFQEEPANER